MGEVNIKSTYLTSTTQFKFDLPVKVDSKEVKTLCSLTEDENEETKYALECTVTGTKTFEVDEAFVKKKNADDSDEENESIFINKIASFALKDCNPNPQPAPGPTPESSSFWLSLNLLLLFSLVLI